MSAPSGLFVFFLSYVRFSFILGYEIFKNAAKFIRSILQIQTGVTFTCDRVGMFSLSVRKEQNNSP